MKQKNGPEYRRQVAAQQGRTQEIVKEETENAVANCDENASLRVARSCTELIEPTCGQERGAPLGVAVTVTPELSDAVAPAENGHTTRLELHLDADGNPTAAMYDYGPGRGQSHPHNDPDSVSVEAVRAAVAEIETRIDGCEPGDYQCDALPEGTMVNPGALRRAWERVEVAVGDRAVETLATYSGGEDE